MLHWVMILLGLPMMGAAAFLNQSVLTDATDFQRYAFPFWLFLSGVILVFAGTWLREQLRSFTLSHAGAHSGAHAGIGIGTGSGYASAGPGVPFGQGRQVEPARATDTGSLSALTPRAAPGASRSLPPAELQSRIAALESDNERLRRHLLDAKASMSR